MATDTERREVAQRLRGMGEELGSSVLLWYHIAKILGVRTATDGKTACDMLADLIDPDVIPGNPDETGRPLSKPIERWTSFDDRLPDSGTPVLCRSKNGVFYVGKPVTVKGKRTRMVWVPRGGQYRTPDMWRPIEVPAGSAEIDRDALLALADGLCDGYPYGLSHGGLEQLARRIRDALGVNDG